MTGIQGIILAAGRGSRMGAATDDRPKCLTRLGGRTLLSWQLAAFAAAGIADVTVVRGYLAQCLPGHDAEGRCYATRDNPRWAGTNMMASLAAAGPILTAHPCLVSYADIAFHPDNLRALAAAGGDIAIVYDRAWRALWQDRFDDPLDDAETFAARDGRLLAIGQRPRALDEVQGQYMGLLRFTPAGWSAVAGLLRELPPAAVDRLDMTGLLNRLLAAGVAIEVVAVDGRWVEVDRPEDHALYRRRLADVDAGGAWRHDWRW